MSTTTNARYQEADLLTRATANVLRKLIRFLVGRITLVKLQQMIRLIFVEETEKKIRAENPGRNVPLTQLALNTGLDTRTLTRLREHLERDDPLYRRQFLAELTPESAVVEAWSTAVAAGETGRVLAYGDDGAAFERLVRSTISTRGITMPSIIQRLVDTRSVAQDREKRELSLLVDHFSPYLSDDEPNMVNAAFSAISNLLSTMEHNIATHSDERLFQRQVWTFRLRPEDQADFRRAMRRQLEGYERAAIDAIEPWEQLRYGDQLLTAGIGLYYFEEASGQGA